MTQKPIIPPYEFYMVRHGESDANLRKVSAGGGLDSPLSEAGVMQAKALASVIHHLPVKPSRVYHSPQIRAKHTANYLNEILQLEMVEVHDLKEHIFGDWENVSWEITKPLVAQGINPPNGETYEEFGQRISNAIHHIFETSHDAPPMLVAHGGLFRSIGRRYNVPMEHVGNCALYQFTPTAGNTNFPWSVISHTPCPTNGLKQVKLF